MEQGVLHWWSSSQIGVVEEEGRNKDTTYRCGFCTRVRLHNSNQSRDHDYISAILVRGTAPVHSFVLSVFLKVVEVLLLSESNCADVG